MTDMAHKMIRSKIKIAAVATLMLLPMSSVICAPSHSGHKQPQSSLLEQCQGTNVLASVHCGRVPTPVFAKQGVLWLVFAQHGHVYLTQSLDRGATFTAPRVINVVPERIHNDGENRPKIALGLQGDLYVSWTEKTAGKYTGNVRFSRSLDGGKSFSIPITVNNDRSLISHRFDSLVVDGSGRIFITWIDKRDFVAAKTSDTPYSGAAIYYAVSGNRGESFPSNYKLVDHSCECCRIALDLDVQGTPVALWRHVYPVNVRDHAIAYLDVDASPIEETPLRATNDGWIMDGCPHQGPDLAVDRQNKAHLTWFTRGKRNAGLLYGRFDLEKKRLDTQHVLDGGSGASRPRVAVTVNGEVVTAWLRFNGIETELLFSHSSDNGGTWRESHPLASTANASDQPLLLVHEDRVYVSWHTAAEGYRLIEVSTKDAVHAL